MMLDAGAGVGRVTLSTSTLTRAQGRPACVMKRRNCIARK